MTFASTIHTGIWLSAALAIVGCGSSGTSSNAFRNNGVGSGYDATSGDDGGSGSGSSSGNNSTPSNGGGTSSSGSSGGSGTCATTCRANTDCQNSCPAAASGSTNCCDTTSGTCFVSPMSACPSQSTGAAE